MSYTLRGQQKLVVFGNKIHERLFSPKGINKWGKLGKLTKNDTFIYPLLGHVMKLKLIVITQLAGF